MTSDLKAIFLKLASYCAYQERSMQEVYEKLRPFRLSSEEEQEIIEALAEENFLNQRRFAETYAQSKFRQKQWGKIKIAQGLKQKGVPQMLSQQALDTIDAEDYYKTALSLSRKKLEQLDEALLIFQKKQKTYNYLLQKGYESSLIGICLEELLG